MTSEQPQPQPIIFDSRHVRFLLPNKPSQVIGHFDRLPIKLTAAEAKRAEDLYAILDKRYSFWNVIELENVLARRLAMMASKYSRLGRRDILFVIASTSRGLSAPIFSSDETEDWDMLPSTIVYAIIGMDKPFDKYVVAKLLHARVTLKDKRVFEVDRRQVEDCRFYLPASATFDATFSAYLSGISDEENVLESLGTALSSSNRKIKLLLREDERDDIEAPVLSSAKTKRRGTIKIKKGQIKKSSDAELILDGFVEPVKTSTRSNPVGLDPNLVAKMMEMPVGATVMFAYSGELRYTTIEDRIAQALARLSQRKDKLLEDDIKDLTFDRQLAKPVKGSYLFLHIKDDKRKAISKKDIESRDLQPSGKRLREEIRDATISLFEIFTELKKKLNDKSIKNKPEFLKHALEYFKENLANDVSSEPMKEQPLKPSEDFVPSTPNRAQTESEVELPTELDAESDEVMDSNESDDDDDDDDDGVDDDESNVDMSTGSVIRHDDRQSGTPISGQQDQEEFADEADSSEDEASDSDLEDDITSVPLPVSNEQDIKNRVLVAEVEPAEIIAIENTLTEPEKKKNQIAAACYFVGYLITMPLAGWKIIKERSAILPDAKGKIHVAIRWMHDTILLDNCDCTIHYDLHSVDRNKDDTEIAKDLSRLSVTRRVRLLSETELQQIVQKNDVQFDKIVPTQAVRMYYDKIIQKLRSPETPIVANEMDAVSTIIHLELLRETNDREWTGAFSHALVLLPIKLDKSGKPIFVRLDGQTGPITDDDVGGDWRDAFFDLLHEQIPPFKAHWDPLLKPWLIDEDSNEISKADPSKKQAATLLCIYRHVTLEFGNLIWSSINQGYVESPLAKF